MGRIAHVIELAKKNPKKIVLPEAYDERVVEAAKRIRKEKIADLIPVEPSAEGALFSAADMVRRGAADSFVAGATHLSKDVIRTAMQSFGVDRSMGVVSGVFIVEVEDCPYGEDGFFVFADCAVAPLPSPRQLARVALSSGDLLKNLFGKRPKIAFLTYSSHGSGEGESIDRARAALPIVREKRPDFVVDGELQLDAAIIPEVQKRKAPESPLAGQANVLIFPNLDAGNITYKAVERFGKAKAVGPILLGLNKVCSDLSRGCSVDDIVNVVALVSALAHLREKK